MQVTVITVVRNDVKHIRATLESALAQEGVSIQYLVLDGASDDGTADIIREFAPRLSYWHSRPDSGMYEALNQAIEMAEGEWISILNSGDVYSSTTALRDALDLAQNVNGKLPDVLYGHSIEANPEWNREVRSVSDLSLLRFAPTFRHGSSLIRTSAHKSHLFDLSKKSSLGYALDWEMLHRLYIEGYHFQYVDIFIETYLAEGLSNHPYRNLLYNYRITAGNGVSRLKAAQYFVKNATYIALKDSCLYTFIHAFSLEYMVNDILPHIPFWSWRRAYLRLIGMKIGKGTFIHKRNQFINPNLITIGEYSHVNSQCILDARGGLTIGSSVSISHRVNILTGSHDYKSPNFQGVFHPIEIHDYVWVGAGATILQGVKLGRGSVVCAGAVVTHNVPDYAVVAGVPAKQISTRPENLEYRCQGAQPLT